MFSALVLSTVVIFVAELGDKSQLMAMTFATRYRARDVILGITAATAVVHLASVGIGYFIGASFERYQGPIAIAAGIAFLGFAAWTLRGDELTDEEADGAAVAASPEPEPSMADAAEAASEETTNGHSLKREFEGPHRLAGPVGDVRPGSPQVCVGGAVVVVRPARPHHPRRCPPARPVRRVDRVRAPRPAPRGLPPMSSQYPTGYQGYPYSEPFAPHQPYGVAGIRQALAEGAAARSEPVRLVRVDGIDWPVVPANPYAGRSPVLAAMWLHGYQGVEEKGPADGGLQLPR